MSRSADALDEVRLAIEEAGGHAEVRACDIGNSEALSTLIAVAPSLSSKAGD